MGDQGENLRRESTNPQYTENGIGGTKKSCKVAVIGCGAAGLVAARELLREGHRVSVFEQRDTVGGVWVYDPEIETDLLGTCADRQRVHSSMYASLRTNLPRELMGFLDYPFIPNDNENEKEKRKEGYQKRDTRRYPGHAEVASYLQDFAQHYGLMEYIRFSTVVEYAGVCEIGESNEISWKVRTRRVGEKTTAKKLEEDFDAAVVCNGHYFEPYVAPIPGINEWPGRQMHSHNYREPNAFADQVVVVIGNAFSGMEISTDMAEFAKEIHLSGRTWPPGSSNVDVFEQPSGPRGNIWHRSMVEYLCQDGTVKFKDGGSIQPDIILHCTGYLYSFPFLDSNGKVVVEENCVGPLYEQVFAPALAPTLSFVGLPKKVLPFILCELQSRWIAMALSGRIELPSVAEMLQSVQATYVKLKASGKSKRSAHTAFTFQFEYYDWLCDQTGRDRVESWRKELFDAVVKNRMEMKEAYNLDIIVEKELYEEAMTCLEEMRNRERDMTPTCMSDFTLDDSGKLIFEPGMTMGQVLMPLALNGGPFW